MENIVALALCIALTVGACLILELHNAKARNVKVAHDMPRSGKHVRHTVWADRVTVSYYGHNGRKVTSRDYPMNRYRAVLQSARNKGYRVI